MSSTKSFYLTIPFTLILVLINALMVNAQLVNIPVTGFNNDIVANGVGTNSVPGISHIFGVDGAGYYFIDNTFKYSSSSALPTCFMPTNNLAASTRTAGLTYQLQSYSGLNALTLDNNSTSYTTSPFPNTGALTLSTPASYSKLFVLYETVLNTPTMFVDAVVTFTDATTQSFTNNSCSNWFTTNLPAFSNVGRGTPSGNLECGVHPNLFELQLTLSAANYSKQVQSISFTIPTQLTVGAFPYSVNYFHAMAVGGNITPLSVDKALEFSDKIKIYPNPATDHISIESSNLFIDGNFEMYDVLGTLIRTEKIEATPERINLSAIIPGVYFYKITKDMKMISSGKLVLVN